MQLGGKPQPEAAREDRLLSPEMQEGLWGQERLSLGTEGGRVAERRVVREEGTRPSWAVVHGATV